SPRSPLLHPGDQSATIEAVAAGLAEGDPEAVKVVRDLARYLGAAVAGLVNVLNPEVVVLGSWVAIRLGEPLLREVREAVARHALKRPLAATRIVLSPILTDSVCMGAATLALEGALQAGGKRTKARSRTAPPS
ncbi:MAG TPA: ROK family protein, partial [Streptomyces sp.]